jgi:predicted secreted protein
LVDDQYAQAGHAEQPGAGGTRTFVMRADAEGVSDVQLKLWRPWGGDASVERRLGFRVTVNR